MTIPQPHQSASAQTQPSAFASEATGPVAMPGVPLGDLVGYSADILKPAALNEEQGIELTTFADSRKQQAPAAAALPLRDAAPAAAASSLADVAFGGSKAQIVSIFTPDAENEDWDDWGDGEDWGEGAFYI